MRNVYRTFNIYLAMCLVFSVLTLTPLQLARAAEPAAGQELTSPESFLNSDGTLNLDGNFNGAFDLKGWDVTVDPKLGPVFSPQAIPQGKWDSLGAGQGPIQNTVYAIAVSGSDVYIGGSFINVDNIQTADGIVKWSGGVWSALGDNGAGDGALSGAVYAIAVDPYSGGIYVGGGFAHAGGVSAANFIAHWDGSSWSALGHGATIATPSLSDVVQAIVVDEDYVYAGGSFANVNNNGTSLPSAAYLARFDKAGETWSALGSVPLSGIVLALAWGDTGLYVGGNFVNAGGLNAADFIVKWGGTDLWSALGNNGAGGGSLNSTVRTIAITGTGPSQHVIVGGHFTAVYDGSLVPLSNVSYLTFWDGADWGAMSSGASPINYIVRSITLIGTDIYVGGEFSNAGGIPEADYIAKLSIGVWSALGNNGAGDGALNNYVYALAGNGGRIYAGGFFTEVYDGSTPLHQNNFFAQWENGSWIPNTPRAGSFKNNVNCIAVDGTDVYVGGAFYNLSNNGVENPAADYIAKWDGSNWSNLGSNGAGDGALANTVNAIVVKGNFIYVGGNFMDVNNNGITIPEADYLAKWDGTNWSAVGNTAALNGQVNALTASPTSADLYIGGNFQDAGGNLAADYVVKFDGTSWLALGDNGSGDGSINNKVTALALQENILYIGGIFGNVMDGLNLLTASNTIAKWDGAHWSAVGSGASSAISAGSVDSLLVNGSDLYVGGSFINVFNNGVSIPQADYVAKWDGTNWSALGDNGSGDGIFDGEVFSLAMYGNHLYAGGYFTNAGSSAGDYILDWDGTQWSPLSTNGSNDGSLSGASVYALAVGGQNLYVGGYFYNVNDNGTILSKADYIAAYGLDTNPPSVTSIIRASANPTSASSVNYTVTFSESVTGVGSADFNLTTSGVSGASVSGVSGSGKTYTVTVNSGTSSGTLRLNLTDDNSVLDVALNPLGGASLGDGNFTTGEVYTKASGDTVGVFRPSNGALYMKNANTTGFADYVLTYGLPGDYPVVGDWDGNGTVTLGVYRNGNFYLRNSNTNGFADMVIAFGAAGDQPVAGDWNGDGIDTIGLYRSSIGMFFLRNSNSSGDPDISFSLGVAGDVGIAGDWNGDGTDTTGVFRPTNGALYLKNANTTGFADIVLTYGLPGDKPVTGDWNNDGIDTIGVYRDGGFYLRNSNTNGFADINLALGINGDMPIAGNWDGLP